MGELDDIRTEQLQLRERQARIEGINEQILARLTSIEAGQRWLFGLMFTGVLVIAGALITLAMNVSNG